MQDWGGFVIILPYVSPILSLPPLLASHLSPLRSALFPAQRRRLRFNLLMKTAQEQQERQRLPSGMCCWCPLFHTSTFQHKLKSDSKYYSFSLTWNETLVSSSWIICRQQRFFLEGWGGVDIAVSKFSFVSSRLLFAQLNSLWCALRLPHMETPDFFQQDISLPVSQSTFLWKSWKDLIISRGVARCSVIYTGARIYVLFCSPSASCTNLRGTGCM